jgi:hypothetical protein
VHRAAASANESAAVERLALANPTTMQRVQEVTRERKAMARLIELAAGDGVNGGEKPRSRKEKTADQAETSDTGRHSPEAQASVAPVAEEN